MIDVYYLVNANLRDLCTGDQSVCGSCRMLDDFFPGIFVIELDMSSCGLSLSFLNRNSGPFHHLLSETKPLADMPHDRISAGFWLPGQNLHDSGVVCTRISCTLLMTYCFQGLNSLFNIKQSLSGPRTLFPISEARHSVRF